MSQSKDDWRPIETAPDDGTEILVCMTHNLPDCGAWETIMWVDWQRGPYVWPNYERRIDIPFPPTRWQPLPPPPDSPSERKR